ncbi:hypothetical protein Hamer_G000096 [Homarus americanus]|uniref:Uncharacterized protein n=1 Tax=Homarus americanus TaxID=6706 RepID=A0A8J5TKE0_HOMAM|nr:hypothetical protein Hamer_G000096 [Homarus americanus]
MPVMRVSDPVVFRSLDNKHNAHHSAILPPRHHTWHSETFLEPTPFLIMAPPNRPASVTPRACRSPASMPHSCVSSMA